MSVTDEYLQNNENYAAGFSGPLPLPPARKTAVVACMDARINVYGVLGLKEGDSHVIRNAGGIVADDTIRSLAISQHLLGTEEIVLIHHTDCGMLTFTDEQFAGILEDAAGERPNWTRQRVPRPRGRRPRLDQAHHRQPVRQEQGLDPRVRLRRRDREAERGQVGRCASRS